MELRATVRWICLSELSSTTTSSETEYESSFFLSIVCNEVGHNKTRLCEAGSVNRFKTYLIQCRLSNTSLLCSTLYEVYNNCLTYPVNKPLILLNDETKRRKNTSKQQIKLVYLECTSCNQWACLCLWHHLLVWHFRHRLCYSLGNK